MSTEAMPPEGKYVKNDTTKSALAEGTLLKLMKLGLSLIHISEPTRH